MIYLPSLKEIKTLEKLGPKGLGILDALDSQGINKKALTNRNTRLFKEFTADLNLMIEYYPIFARRFRKHPEVKENLLKLNRKIRESSEKKSE